MADRGSNIRSAGRTLPEDPGLWFPRPLPRDHRARPPRPPERFSYSSSTLMGEPTYDATLGVIQIGAMIAMFLFGISTIQMFIYYQKHFKDVLPLKVLVGTIWCLECAHAALACRTIYWFTVTKYGMPETIRQMPNFVSLNGLVSHSISSTVQIYFAFRLWKLSQSWILPSISCLLSFVRFVFFAVAVAQRLLVKEQTRHWRWILNIVGVMSASADFLIAISLCYCFWKRRNSLLGCNGTRTVNRVLSCALQTDLLTCVSTIISMVLFKKVKGLAWMAMSFIVCRLFFISLLASLLGRERHADNIPNQPAPDFMPTLLPFETKDTADTFVDERRGSELSGTGSANTVYVV